MLFALAAPACAVPNVPAATVRAAVPEMPPMAAQVGISGRVSVRVDLDDASRVRGTTILASPSVLLNAAALDAVRRSTFSAAVRDCRPVAGSYVMSVDFGGTPAVQPPPASDAPVTTVVADGRASAPPDVATAHVEFATRAADGATAIAQTDKLAESFRSALRGLGIDPSALTAGFYDVLPAGVGAPSAGYVASRELILTTTVASLQPVFDAAAASGATAGTVAYDVADRKALYDAAVVAAMQDAALRTDRAAAEKHVRRGAVVRSRPTFASTAPLERVTFAPRPARPAVPPPHPVELRVRLAITYSLQPE